MADYGARGRRSTPVPSTTKNCKDLCTGQPIQKNNENELEFSKLRRASRTFWYDLSACILRTALRRAPNTLIQILAQPGNIFYGASSCSVPHPATHPRNRPLRGLLVVGKHVGRPALRLVYGADFGGDRRAASRRSGTDTGHVPAALQLQRSGESATGF